MGSELNLSIWLVLLLECLTFILLIVLFGITIMIYHGTHWVFRLSIKNKSL